MLIRIFLLSITCTFLAACGEQPGQQQSVPHFEVPKGLQIPKEYSATARDGTIALVVTNDFRTARWKGPWKGQLVRSPANAELGDALVADARQMLQTFFTTVRAVPAMPPVGKPVEGARYYIVPSLVHTDHNAQSFAWQEQTFAMALRWQVFTPDGTKVYDETVAGLGRGRFGMTWEIAKTTSETIQAALQDTFMKLREQLSGVLGN